MSFTTACATRLKDDDEIKQASESYLESMQLFYLTDVKKLFDRCKTDVVEGDYVE